MGDASSGGYCWKGGPCKEEKRAFQEKLNSRMNLETSAGGNVMQD